MTNSSKILQLDRSINHLLKRATQYANNLYMESVGKSGLTQRQFTVLLSTYNNQGISQIDLVKLTGIDRSTLADLVARLVDQGYLQRNRTKQDGRINSLKLTIAGQKAVVNALPGANRVDKQLLACVPNKHRKDFVEGLLALSEMYDVTSVTNTIEAQKTTK